VSDISIFSDYSDDARRSVDRRFLYALLASLLAHTVLTSFVAPLNDSSAKVPSRTAPVKPLRFRMLPRPAAPLPQEVAPQKERERALPPKSRDASAQSAPPAPSRENAPEDVPQTIQQERRPTRTLDLSIPLLEEPAVRSSSSANLSSQSATVFDQRFAQSLREHRERAAARTPSATVPNGSAVEGTNLGVRWQSFVKIGKLCFDVIAADPLDSFSTNQWFPRDCD